MEKQKLDFIKSLSDNHFLRLFFSSQICDFIACQFALESDFGKSKLATQFNNFCGMKLPLRRVRYSLPTCYKDFSTYSTLDQCIIDYIVRFLSFNPPCNAVYELEAFKFYLKYSHYCTENDYLSRIEKIYKQFINSQNSQNND